MHDPMMMMQDPMMGMMGGGMQQPTLEPTEPGLFETLMAQHQPPPPPVAPLPTAPQPGMESLITGAPPIQPAALPMGMGLPPKPPAAMAPPMSDMMQSPDLMNAVLANQQAQPPIA